MIAESQATGATLAREETYEIRRALVARLQSAARGVTRRRRVEHHRAFARDWERFRDEGRLGLLRRALEIGPAVASEAGSDWRVSFLLGLAAGLVPEGPLVGTPWESAPEPISVQRTDASNPGSGLDSQGRGEGRRTPQAELFFPELVARPI